MKSNGNLTIIPKFHTYQQTTDYTCGPAAALMVAEYYGVHGLSEAFIASDMNIKSPSEVKRNYGTSTKQLVTFFRKCGFETLSSLDANSPVLYSPIDFKDWMIRNLKENIPVMVNWIDWGGHWQVIIGYDTLGTESVSDDVIIFADPLDTTDHKQDGYYIFSAERFFYMWFDPEVTKSYQQWVIVKGGS